MGIVLVARFAACVAAVECPALQLNATWTNVARDAQFERTVAVVREAERTLAKAMVERWPRLL